MGVAVEPDYFGFDGSCLHFVLEGAQSVEGVGNGGVLADAARGMLGRVLADGSAGGFVGDVGEIVCGVTDSGNFFHSGYCLTLGITDRCLWLW